MASRFNHTETPNVVLIGVPNKSDLKTIMERLQRYGIGYEAFYEPDYNLGLTAIATYPITNKKQRRALGMYKLWTPQTLQLQEVEDVAA